MLAWFIAVEGAIAIEQITFCEKTGVEIALLQVERGLLVMVDMVYLLSTKLADRVLEHKQSTMYQHYRAACKRCVSVRLTVEDARHMNRSAACHSTHIIEFR